jgi:hypothetical protein
MSHAEAAVKRGDRVPDAAVLRSVHSLYDSARRAGIGSFETLAIRQLGTLVGFDGAVWGAGSVDTAGAFSITHASVVDRPISLLAEYGEVAQLDPVTARFLKRPGRPLAVGVDRYYAHRRLAPVADYLHRHRIIQR